MKHLLMINQTNSDKGLIVSFVNQSVELDAKSGYYIKKRAQRFSSKNGKDQKIDQRVEKLIKIFSKMDCDILLDIGCSRGKIGNYLSKACGAKEVIGIDLSKNDLKEARTFGTCVIQCDFEKTGLPFSDNSFSTIYVGEVVEHLFNPSYLLKEIYRVLKFNGRCVLDTPNLASWSNRLLLLAGYQPFYTHADFENGNVGKVKKLRQPNEPGEHIRSFTNRSLKELINIHGFKIEAEAGASIKIAANNSLPVQMITKIDRFLCLHPAWSTIQIIIFTKE